jgi:hypothetical protein
MVSLFFNIYSYLIEASVEKVCVLVHGQGELPTIKLNVALTQTSTVSPETGATDLRMPVSLSLIVNLTRVSFDGFESLCTPGEQQTAHATSLVLGGLLAGGPGGHVKPPHCISPPVLAVHGTSAEEVGVRFVAGFITTAILAPCLAAFFIEFFVYQALENSVIPKRISSNRKSTNAVSINV